MHAYDNVALGWERVWTAAGAVPRDVGLIIGREFSPQVHSRIMQAANKCAKTAEKIWAERNKENEAWVDSIPVLKARKVHANRKQWRHESQQPRAQRVRKMTRIQQKKDDREVPSARPRPKTCTFFLWAPGLSEF